MPKQAVAVELFYNGVWNNLVTTNDVLADTPIVITRGDGAESAAPRPATITLRLNNDDDMFRTSNPMSPLYGKAGVGTPLRVSVAGVVRGYVEASSWEADQSADFRRSPPRGVAWVDVTGGGILQRVNQWTLPVKSPLRLATESVAGLCGYWPMEDKAGTTVATSVVDGTFNSALLGNSFGSQNSPPGGGPAVDVGADNGAVFQCLRGDPQSTNGWQYNYCVYLNTLGTDSAIAWGIVNVHLLNGWIMYLHVNGPLQTAELDVVDPTGSLVATSTVSTAGYQWTGRWLMIQLQTSYSAGTTTVGVYWRAVGEGFWNTMSTTYTGVTSDLNQVGGSIPEASSYAHVAGTQGLAEMLTSNDRVDAFESYPGERAADRFARLLDEVAIAYTVSAGSAASMPLGPQGIDALPQQLQELRDTEDGLLFDYRTDGRLFFLCRADRLNQTPALTLNALANPTGMPALPAETTDDQTIHNIVTASQRGGGDVTAEDSTSTMSTQPPPAGRGVYQQTVDVNVDDPAGNLPQTANWYLRRGTVDKPRYPQVTVDLSSLSATTIAAVEAVDIGAVIQIVNFREYTVRLFVIGYVETIDTHTRTITFTCAPDQQFDIGVLDTNRLQARATTLNADITSTATALTLTMTDPNEVWRPGNNAVPVLIGGELITLGTVAAVSGTGPWTQAVTGCTRSVNGIVKTHSAGDQVTVDQAIRLGLKEAA